MTLLNESHYILFFLKEFVESFDSLAFFRFTLSNVSVLLKDSNTTSVSDSSNSETFRFFLYSIVLFLKIRFHNLVNLRFTVNSFEFAGIRLLSFFTFDSQVPLHSIPSQFFRLHLHSIHSVCQIRLFGLSGFDSQRTLKNSLAFDLQSLWDSIVTLSVVSNPERLSRVLRVFDYHRLPHSIPKFLLKGIFVLCFQKFSCCAILRKYFQQFQWEKNRLFVQKVVQNW